MLFINYKQSPTLYIFPTNSIPWINFLITEALHSEWRGIDVVELYLIDFWRLLLMR